jgi:hypothetical protein
VTAARHWLKKALFGAREAGSQDSYSSSRRCSPGGVRIKQQVTNSPGYRRSVVYTGDRDLAEFENPARFGVKNSTTNSFGKKRNRRVKYPS